MNNIQQRIVAISTDIFSGIPVLFAYLYGSHARGTPHPFSDLDIGIYVEAPDHKTDLDLELSLSLRIDELMHHNVSTEVRVLNHLPLALIGQILTEGKLIYSRDEVKRVQFETQLRMAYFDFLPVIRHQQSVYRQKITAGAQDDRHG